MPSEITQSGPGWDASRLLIARRASLAVASVPSMGLDVTVLMADWARLARMPASERLDALADVAYPDFCCSACEDEDLAMEGGWVWPRGQQDPWCAEYRFFHTSGSYKWHWELGNAWGDVRPFIAPDLRDSLDVFLGGLVWDGPDASDCPPPAGGFPDDPAPWRPKLLLLRTPDEVPALARSWERAAPRLEELREPFDAEATRWAGRPKDFDHTVALMGEWGEIVTEADRRGWGLIGLPY